MTLIIDMVYITEVQQYAETQLGIIQLEVDRNARVLVLPKYHLKNIIPFHIHTDRQCFFDWSDVVRTATNTNDYLWPNEMKWKNDWDWAGPFIRFKISPYTFAKHPSGGMHIVEEIKISVGAVFCHGIEILKSAMILYDWLEHARKVVRK